MKPFFRKISSQLFQISKNRALISNSSKTLIAPQSNATSSSKPTKRLVLPFPTFACVSPTKTKPSSAYLSKNAGNWAVIPPLLTKLLSRLIWKSTMSCAITAGIIKKNWMKLPSVRKRCLPFWETRRIILRVILGFLEIILIKIGWVRIIWKDLQNLWIGRLNFMTKRRLGIGIFWGEIWVKSSEFLRFCKIFELHPKNSLPSFPCQKLPSVWSRFRFR